MAEIVNLRMARKQKARAQRERVAEQNRAAFGRSKAERDTHRQAADKADKFIEDHRLSSAELEQERKP